MPGGTGVSNHHASHPWSEPRLCPQTWLLKLLWSKALRRLPSSEWTCWLLVSVTPWPVTSLGPALPARPIASSNRKWHPIKARAVSSGARGGRCHAGLCSLPVCKLSLLPRLSSLLLSSYPSSEAQLRCSLLQRALPDCLPLQGCPQPRAGLSHATLGVFPGLSLLSGGGLQDRDGE